MKKGQAGLDFLMTYGWALLIIVLVVGALFALGIFNINSFMGSRATGFTQIGVVAWGVANTGVMTAMFANHAGTGVNVTNITATLGVETITYNTTFDLSNLQTSGTITIGNFTSQGAIGAPYTINMVIKYTDLATGFAYTDSGAVTGKVN